MKIAFCNRPNFDNPLGGDGIQMLKTKEYIERLYPHVSIDIVTNAEDISSDYDIVHIFNFVTYQVTYTFFEKAKSLDIPIVSSCIFWDYTFASPEIFFMVLGYPSFINRGCVSVLSKLARISAFFTNYPMECRNEMRRHYRKFVNMSNLILPNSIEEGRLLLKFVKQEDSINKIRVVYNGVEFEKTKENDKYSFDLRAYNLPDRYVLEVARIEYIKGQLNLITALRDFPEIPLVFVGRLSESRYCRKVKKMAEKRGNVFFINSIPHEHINWLYKNAALHILPSLRESPGLVSLEAQSVGCPIVVSGAEFLPLTTYFSDTPYIIDPLNKESIRETVLTAYKERKCTPFDFERFSWANVAKQTFMAYCELLK